MTKFVPTQYYGYFDYASDDSVFHVCLIKPAGSALKDWIGARDCALANMLCIDDLILSVMPFTVDWSKVQYGKN